MNKELERVFVVDGKIVLIEKKEFFLYYCFEVMVDLLVDENDLVEVVWKGSFLLGRKVMMYVWNYWINEWQLVDSFVVRNDKLFMLKVFVIVFDFVWKLKMNVIVQDEIFFVKDMYIFVWMFDIQYYVKSYLYIFDK